MIKQLKIIFPSLIKKETTMTHTQKSVYQWFKTPDHQVLGILKQELSQKEVDLLTTFLQPYEIGLPVKSENEIKWSNLINHSVNFRLNNHNIYRFIYFITPMKEMNPIEFKDAINQLFDQNISILWENEYEGVIIEEQHEDDDKISYDQIIDILMSDLYIKINFLVGSFQHNLKLAPSYFEQIIKGGQKAFAYSDKNVLTYVEAVPFIVVDQLENQFKKHLTVSVLNEFIGDKEFKHMIEVFLDSNLNISVTAKKLYMHRNSLQYRFDRFRERTGIDVRNFHQALTVYLALISDHSSQLAQNND